MCGVMLLHKCVFRWRQYLPEGSQCLLATVVVENILICLVEHTDHCEHALCHFGDECLHCVASLQFQELESTPAQELKC